MPAAEPAADEEPLTRSAMPEVEERAEPVYEEPEEQDGYGEDDRNEDVRVDAGPVDAAKAIYLDHVGFSYGREPVLSDIFYAFGKGRAYIVRGESGSGKSTLAMLLNGLLPAKKGRIFYEGRQLPLTRKRVNPARQDIDADDGMIHDINQIRRKVGYVNQNPEKQLFADTVIKDVMFGPRNLGFDNNGAVKMARNALTYMNVDEAVWKRPVDQISGGEKRRVGIAGIIANTPEYLVLDESDAGLDDNGVQQAFTTHFLNHWALDLTDFLTENLTETLGVFHQVLFLDDLKGGDAHAGSDGVAAEGRAMLTGLDV